MWRKGNPFALLVGMQTGASIVENSREFPQNIKCGTAFWPSDSNSGDISEETQNTNSEEYMQPYVHCSIIYNGQDMEAAQVDRGADEKVVVQLHNGILLSHKKEQHVTIANSMDEPRGYYAQ